MSLPPLGYVLSFTANGFYAINGDNYLFAITILWSISIEMQFYLLWGAALRFFKQHIYWVAVLLILFSLLFTYMLYSKCSLYYLTATYVPDFMIGALGAKLVYEGLLNMTSVHKGIRGSLYLAAVLVFVLTPFLNTLFFWKMISNCVFSVLTIAIIMDQCADDSLFELGKSKLVSYLGKVSYGLYCFQGFVLPLYTKFLLSHFVDSGAVVKVLLIPFLLFVFTTLLAAMSYRFFESYFLGLKERV
jgi:peptidoglycan/LPS O-acetylase OafA/YrhL